MPIRRACLTLVLALGSAACIADFDADALCSPEREGEACGEDGAGRCRAAECCGGCHDGARCREGDEIVACGARGSMCVACEDTERCADGVCLPATVVRSVVASRGTVCAIDESGRLFCWGLNRSGTAGVGLDSPSVGQPTQVMPGSAWTDVTTSWGYEGHGCGVASDQSAWCWGGNGDGQLGTGTLDGSLGPVRVAPDDGPPWSDVAVGSFASCGIREGSLYCWGSLASFGGVHGREAPTFPMQLVPLRYDGGSNFRSVVMGDVFGCALRSDSVVVCWGVNGSGQLGRDTGGEPAPPGPIGDGFTTVSTGNAHGCGVKEGRVFCWGDNAAGQSGQPPTTLVVQAPTPVGDATSYLMVDAGGDHTCAIDDQARLFCWGDNSDGQLGLGADRVSEVTHVPQLVDDTRRWATVDAGTDFTCGLTEAGVLYCWGTDGQGQQVTPGSAPDVPTPTVIPLPPAE